MTLCLLRPSFTHRTTVPGSMTTVCGRELLSFIRTVTTGAEPYSSAAGDPGEAHDDDGRDRDRHHEEAPASAHGQRPFAAGRAHELEQRADTEAGAAAARVRRRRRRRAPGPRCRGAPTARRRRTPGGTGPR